MHPDRTIGGILFLSCLFVCLLSTLTFAINFEPLEVETSYFYAPGLKGPPGASSNRIVRLSVRPSVCP